MTIDRVSLTSGSERTPAAERILIFEGEEIPKPAEIDIVVKERRLFKRSIEVSALALNELTRRRHPGRNLGFGLVRQGKSGKAQASWSFKVHASTRTNTPRRTTRQSPLENIIPRSFAPPTAPLEAKRGSSSFVGEEAQKLEVKENIPD